MGMGGGASSEAGRGRAGGTGGISASSCCRELSNPLILVLEGLLGSTGGRARFEVAVAGLGGRTAGAERAGISGSLDFTAVLEANSRVLFSRACAASLAAAISAAAASWAACASRSRLVGGRGGSVDGLNAGGTLRATPLDPLLVVDDRE